MYIQGSLLDCMSDRLKAYTGDTEKFIRNYGCDILRGVYKPGVKAFGFECHRGDLESVASLLWADRDGCPGHEIPFLLNQVDFKLRGRFRPSEVTAMVDSSLAQEKECS